MQVLRVHLDICAVIMGIVIRRVVVVGHLAAGAQPADGLVARLSGVGQVHIDPALVGGVVFEHAEDPGVDEEDTKIRACLVGSVDPRAAGADRTGTAVLGQHRSEAACAQSDHNENDEAGIPRRLSSHVAPPELTPKPAGVYAEGKR
jgi:hypothetical protein